VSTAPRRDGPLTLSFGGRDVPLTAAEANALIAMIEDSAAGIERSWHDLGREQPQSLEPARRRLELMRAMTSTMANAPGRFTDPPLVLNPAAAQILRVIFGELMGYQRQELLPGLEALKLEVNRQR
jgi:hypothetical protein